MVACYSIETYDVYTRSRQIVDTKNVETQTTVSGETRKSGLIINLDEARKRIEDEQDNQAVALRSMPLSAEAAATMERMLSDPSTPKHAGEDLPTVSAEELLRRLGR